MKNKPRNKPKRAFMHLGPAGPEATPKIELGSLHALKTKPTSLLNPNSDHRRILSILHAMGGTRTSREICRLFNQKYNASKTVTAISARLSELFTLSLVARRKVQGDKGKVLYSLYPDLNPLDGETLYNLACAKQDQIAKLGQRARCAFARPPSFALIE